MATLSSTSTFAEVNAAYDDNCSYEEDGSTTKAKAFVTACRFLIRLTAENVTGPGGESVAQRVEKYRQEIEAARNWLSTQAGITEGSSGVKFLSIETDFRE